MSYMRRAKFGLAITAIAMFAVSGARVYAQGGAPGAGAPAGAAAAPTVDPMTWGKPTNDLPNPYRTIADWAKLPDGHPWGSTGGDAVDAKGNIWVAERCGANSCKGSDLPPILEFSPDGKLLTSFGAGMFIMPHGVTIDKDGNIWVTDQDGADGKGHVVYKFTPQGKVLMTLGTPGVAGTGNNEFNMPSSVAIAPNGDIFVGDGHTAKSNARIVKFDKTGKFIKTWGQIGSGPGDINIPHALAFDSKGRLFEGDRGNNRIQIFDQDGKLLDTWTQFSRPSGIFIDTRTDTMYVADSESGGVSRDHRLWTRGIRVGSAKDGTVKYLIPDPNTDPNFKGTGVAEGVGVDTTGGPTDGNIYGAEVGPKDLKKYVKNTTSESR